MNSKTWILKRCAISGLTCDDLLMSNEQVGFNVRKQLYFVEVSSWLLYKHKSKAESQTSFIKTNLCFCSTKGTWKDRLEDTKAIVQWQKRWQLSHESSVQRWLNEQSRTLRKCKGSQDDIHHSVLRGDRPNCLCLNMFSVCMRMSGI